MALSPRVAEELARIVGPEHVRLAEGELVPYARDATPPAHLGAGRVAELSAYLVREGHGPEGEVRVGGRRARAGLQDSCHLRNGLGVTAQPRELIAAVADYVELPGAGGCCGAAGTYSLLRRADSRAVLEPKLTAIEAAGVDFVVAVNPGCLRQLRQGLRRRRSGVRAVSLAEFLTEATGPR
jgi:glycolate oxidase iron-sulfur subunit